MVTSDFIVKRINGTTTMFVENSHRLREDGLYQFSYSDDDIVFTLSRADQALKHDVSQSNGQFKYEFDDFLNDDSFEKFILDWSGGYFKVINVPSEQSVYIFRAYVVDPSIDVRWTDSE